MKKNVIAILLSVVLAAGSIGSVPVFAAEITSETDAEKADSVQTETADNEEESEEDAENAANPEETDPIDEVEQEGETDTQESTDDSSAVAEDVESSEIDETEEPNENVEADETADASGNGESNETEESSESGETNEIAETEENSVNEENVVIEEETEATMAKETMAEDVVASGTCGDNATWKLTGKYSNLTLTISGSGAINNYKFANVDIEENHFEFNGPAIPWFSYRSKIRNITIEEGITIIGSNAFSYCSNLTNVELPESLTTIKGNAFGGYDNLKSIRIPSGVTSIESGAISCDKIYIDDLSAWLNCSVGRGPKCNLYLNNTLLTDIVVPNDVTKIGDGVFRDNSSLKSITMSNSVTSIGTYAFSGCSSLTAVTIPGSVTSIEAYTFSNCSSLATVTIADSVTDIGEYAFNECGSLKRISIPDGVTEIKKRTFSKCESLTSVTIPDSVTTISDYAFYHCGNLKQADLPSSITSIGGYAFYGCGMTSIVFPPNVASVGYRAFYGSEITSVQFSEGTTNICKSIFTGCEKLKSVTMPASVRSMGFGLFSGCSSLERIQIRDLESWLNIDFAGEIGSTYSLYLNDQALTHIDFPEDLTRIGNYVFSGCTGLTSITIPDSVTDIGSYAFSGCTGLTSITIPDSVTDIGSYAFSGCTGLTSIAIPDSVTDIGPFAFSGCSGLKSITIPESVTSIGWHAFNKCSGLKTIFIPDSVTGIESYTFNDCSGLTSLSLPSTLTYIGEYAFGYPDEYDHGDLYPGNILDATIIFRGTEEQWKAVSKREVYYKSIVFSTFSVPADFELPKNVYYCTGKPVTPPVTVTYNGEQLTEGTDYELSYQNNINIGMATVEINGIGAYSGNTQLKFRIRLGCPVKVTCKNLADGMKVSWEEVAGAKKYLVYRDNTLLTNATGLYILDKAVKYKSGKKFTYKVVAVDNYGDESEVYRTATYYRLLPTGIKTLTNPSAGKMTVTYNKSSGSSGYVVRYGTKSDMSNAKVISVQGQNTLSRTFSGLVKGKTYYVQVRTYKIDNGVRYYSGYCTTKKITIKK